MADTLKVLSTEISLSNTVGNNVSSASLVRLVNTDANISEIVRQCYANGTVKATVDAAKLEYSRSKFISLTIVGFVIS